ncbi:MAG: RNA polymerase sigma factor [Ornithinimicrobium sp.]
MYAEFAPMVLLRLRRRCRDPEVATEVLQDTFLKVWRSAATYTGRGEVGAWIWAVASRALIDRLRHDGVRPRLVLVGEPSSTSNGPSAEDVVVADLRVTAAIETMSPELRAVLQATVVDGMTAHDAALVLGIPEGTVKTRAARAQTILREALA